MPKMSVNGLIERLEEYRDLVGGDAEVRLVTQSNWPLEYSILGVCSDSDVVAASDDPDIKFFSSYRESESVVYIVEGGQLGYGKKGAWDAAS